MVNKIYIINPQNTSNLSPTAIAQLVPATVRLPISTQFPAVTIVNSSSGQPTGISGYAQGYASIVYTKYNQYDAGSENFSTNVSQMTIGQLITESKNNSTIYFGAVQINYPILTVLIANNPTLYTLTTIFSPDIQSAMMADLAILRISQSSITFAQSTLHLLGISDALAYYAAQFNIDPIVILSSYSPYDFTTPVGDKVKSLKSQPAFIQNATVYALVNGLPKSQGGLGLFQGFNSWMLYPTNMTGTNGSGAPIQNVTLAGRGNNPGAVNTSQIPVNAIAYEISQLTYLTQQSLQFVLSTISSIIPNIKGSNVAILQNLNSESINALMLTSTSTSYTSSPPKSNVIVANVTLALKNTYDAYQADITNPVLAKSLDTTVAQYIQSTSIQNNITDSVNSAFSTLNTKLTLLSNILVSESNPFPPLQDFISLNSTSLSIPSSSNTSVQNITLSAATTFASGNINTIVNSSTVPSLIINPELALITITGQTATLSPPMPASANINLIGSQIYQSLTFSQSESNLTSVNSSSGSN